MEQMDNQLEEIYKYICEKHEKLFRHLNANPMSFHKSGQYDATTDIKDFIESKYNLKELN